MVKPKDVCESATISPVLKRKRDSTMLVIDSHTPTIALTPLDAKSLPQWLEQADDSARNWVTQNGFKARPASTCVLPDGAGNVTQLLIGMNPGDWLWSLAPAALALNAGTCELKPFPTALNARDAHLACLGFELATYAFTRYGKKSGQHPALKIPAGVDASALDADRDAVNLARTLINTAPQDMMPADLQGAAQTLAHAHGATLTATVGDDLLDANYPAIHAVGRASVHAPRLLDLRWGDKSAPRVTLVGKGVCFDSGGLDIKPAAGMRNMKKDMGGAAHALALGQRIMTAQLPVRLRVLVPAVENAISGNAYHPGDVLSTRAGKTVEVDNTDAEGRIILCDALTEACSESPAVLIDFATLTGAARVALGTDVPALFCNNDALAEGLAQASNHATDPIWRMPLYAPYRRMLDSRIADMVNSPSGGFGGAITAALFLQGFVDDDVAWAHYDLMAWNAKTQPGRPEGGEAMGLRATFGYLEQRFAN
jgi:leucyl aminopeptidase